MKKQVAIITSGYFPIPPVRGGAIETLVNLLVEENNVKNGVQLCVYSMYDKDAEQISRTFTNSKIKYIRTPWYIKTIDLITYHIFKNVLKQKKHMSYRYIFQRLHFIRCVSKDISKNSYDYLVFENHPTLLSALKKHKNLKRYQNKYFYHAHNEITNTFGNDKLLKDVRKFICVSEFIQNSIADTLCLKEKDRFTVLRNRVDEQKFTECDNSKIDEFMQKYGIPKGYTLFTFTGRLNPEKGVKELLEAYKIAHPKQSKLIIAGSYFFGSGMKSDYEIELEKVASDIREEIVFTGNIDYSDMPLLYAVSDVIVLPSIWNDPAPLTVIESLTCGKPLITTYSGGIPEYANLNNSLIYAIDDGLVHNLAEGIRILAEDITTRNRLSEAACLESKNWTKESFYEDFLKCLD